MPRSYLNWSLALLLICSFGAAEWDMKEKKTQAVRVDIWGDKTEGVVLKKQLKYGSPVYIVSTIREKNVLKTRMLSSVAFYSLIEDFKSIVISFQDENVPDICEKKVVIQKKEEGEENKADFLCLDSPTENLRKRFAEWYQSIRDRL